VIRNNAHKYSVSAMCSVLQIPRSSYYYKPEPAIHEDKQKLEDAVRDIFSKSRNNYGTRKIKVELAKRSLPASRRKIGEIMKKHGLVSTYTVMQYKPYKTDSNESEAQNQLQRKFNQDEPYAVVVSDLTYVRVAGKWNYVCLFVDLFNREIIGYSSGARKNAALVYKAIASISVRLDRIQMFHTDRGKEFDNYIDVNLAGRCFPGYIFCDMVRDERFDTLHQLRFPVGTEALVIGAKCGKASRTRTAYPRGIANAPVRGSISYAICRAFVPMMNISPQVDRRFPKDAATYPDSSSPITPR
jgi:ribosomal protein S8